MNTTIKDLAKNWWEKELDKTQRDFYFNKHNFPFNDGSIENIFYNEIIIKWAEATSAILSFATEKDIKEAFLKEHTKEQPTVQVIEMFDKVDGSKTFITKEDLEKIASQPQSVDNTIDVEEVNYQSSNLVTEKKEAIEFADYLLGNFEMAEFEKEHPKYIVDDELCWQLAGTKQKYTTVEMYQIYLNDTNKSQPKAIEDNVWDEVERILWNPDQPTGNKIAMLKAKYTLTKK